MIKNIIFDFGDVFINLDKKGFLKRLTGLGISEEDSTIKFILDEYEMGLMSSSEFLNYFNAKLKIPQDKLRSAWNSILLDFPTKRLHFIKELAKSKKYRLFLLSNTNDLHINWIKENWGLPIFLEFKACFEQFYLSQEIHMRKPNANIFEYVLKENNLVANETLFVDDTKEHTVTAKSLGIHVWNLAPGKEDVTQLFTKKEKLF